MRPYFSKITKISLNLSFFHPISPFLAPAADLDNQASDRTIAGRGVVTSLDCDRAIPPWCTSWSRWTQSTYISRSWPSTRSSSIRSVRRMSSSIFSCPRWASKGWCDRHFRIRSSRSFLWLGERVDFLSRFLGHMLEKKLLTCGVHGLDKEEDVAEVGTCSFALTNLKFEGS